MRVGEKLLFLASLAVTGLAFARPAGATCPGCAHHCEDPASEKCKLCVETFDCTPKDLQGFRDKANLRSEPAPGPRNKIDPASAPPLPGKNKNALTRDDIDRFIEVTDGKIAALDNLTKDANAQCNMDYIWHKYPGEDAQKEPMARCDRMLKKLAAKQKQAKFDLGSLREYAQRPAGDDDSQAQSPDDGWQKKAETRLDDLGKRLEAVKHPIDALTDALSRKAAPH